MEEENRRPLEEVLLRFVNCQSNDLQELAVLAYALVRANEEDNMVAVEKMSVEM